MATQVLVRVFHQLPVDKPQKSKWSDDTKTPEITLWNRKKATLWRKIWERLLQPLKKKWSHSCTIPWKIAIIPGKNFLFLSNPWMNPSKYWPLSVLTINFVFFCTSVTYPPCSQKPLTPSPFCYLQPLIKNWVTTFSIAKKGGFFQL